MCAGHDMSCPYEDNFQIQRLGSIYRASRASSLRFLAIERRTCAMISGRTTRILRFLCFRSLLANTAPRCDGLIVSRPVQAINASAAATIPGLKPVECGALFAGLKACASTESIRAL